MAEYKGYTLKLVPEISYPAIAVYPPGCPLASTIFHGELIGLGRALADAMAWIDREERDAN